MTTSPTGAASADRTLSVADRQFIRDGQPHRVLSGAVHYFRVHPDQWRHRLQLLQSMGLNCVETYVPWNLHEPRPGEFNFSGFGDLERFLDIAAELGLDAIVRPGPYICAEWDAGGLPSWLLADEAVPLRCHDSRYLAVVDRWFDELIPRIVRRQTTRGGNVIMVQVENEYGSYGTDPDYLAHLRDSLRDHGITVPLFTSDGSLDCMLTGGTVDGALATVNFGSGAAEAFAALRQHRSDDPLFCMEFWCGWFSHWGEPAPDRRAPSEVAAEAAAILDAGGSINIYMAHGGTNFGGWSGANRAGALHDGDYRPTTTSYDYYAPIDEQGRPTELFHALREVIAPYATGPIPDVPAAPPVLSARELALDAAATLRSVLDAQPEVTGPVPPSFEELDLHYGLARYRTEVPGPRVAQPLHLPGLADRAQVVADGRYLGDLERSKEQQLELAVPGATTSLELLVEAFGRVNYGPSMRDVKGIRGVLHERQYIFGFTAAPLDLTTTPDIDWEDRSDPLEEPGFYRATFSVDEPGDTMVELPGWGRGHLWINGFALGRYWDRGPQGRYFLPGPLLRAGSNELVILELDRSAYGTVRLTPPA